MAAKTIGAVSPESAQRLQATMLRWYRRAKRDLPWRRTTDPYAIWVSEAMLQQTTVAAVIPYWERFLDRFPDLASLAEAAEEDVLALWSGLGYYRRARALRQGAITVMERYRGCVPSSVDALMDLPGVGRYTAGAIASVAFGRAEPVVDGNVKRVFSRLFALRGRAASERACWSIAGSLMSKRSPGNWNQALMELGATICTPKAPRCGECPVSTSCRAHAMGKTEAYPSVALRKKARTVPVTVAWIERRGRVLLERHHPGGPLRGTWDLPAAFAPSGETQPRTIARELAKRHGVRFVPGAKLLEAKHAILDTRLAIEVVAATFGGPLRKKAALRFVEPGKLDRVATSSATAKIVRGVLAQKRSQLSRASSSSAANGRAKA